MEPTNIWQRWFTYLDVLGSFSARSEPQCPAESTWALDCDGNEENDYQIDCLLGFTSACVNLLAKIAELARQCDIKRIDSDRNIRPDWEPSDEVRARANKLIKDVEAARTHVLQPCTHLHSASASEVPYQWDNPEMAAINDAYHWTGLVHIHRRILGKPSTHQDVRNAVDEIVGNLFKVRKGSTAEACLLFPMFTAGCETLDETQKLDIMDRVMNVETLGMTQVHKARTLMQKVWDTGKPWETLIAAEFLG